jgi:hypothetical protein
MRVPPQPYTPKHGFHDPPMVKRRRLDGESRSPKEDDSRDKAIGTISCEPTVSFTNALSHGYNQSAEVLQGTDIPAKSTVTPHNSGCFQREIRMELLEIVDKLDERDELHSLVGTDFETRCTLEVFIAKYEEAPGGIKLRCGEDVWRNQQMGLIRNISDDFGHITSHIILPRPFVVPAEDLFVKKQSKRMKCTADQEFRLGLADQYVVKVWLEAPMSKSRWPPFELQSAMDPNGRMMMWLREGTFPSTDLRLMCKGVLFSEEGVSSSFDMVLKLGGVQIQTKYTLRLDIKYSLPPRALAWPNLQVLDSPGENRQMSGTHSPDLATRTRCPRNWDADVYMEDNKPAENPSREPQKLQGMKVPRTKQRLCDAINKHILTPEEELHGIDDNLETYWRTTKHVEMVNSRPDISTNAKDYIIKWDSYVTPLRLSSNFYLPQVLLRFLEENRVWFAEQSCRVREFSLHAASLRLRGSIDIECFAKCVILLQEHSRLYAAPEEIHQESPVKDAIEHAAGEEAAKERALDEVAVGEEDVNEEAIDGGAMAEEKTNSEVRNRGAADEEDAEQNISDQDEALGNAMNKYAAGDIQTLTLKRDANRKSADEEAVYEGTSEEIEALGIDYFFGAEDGEGMLQQPFYFHSYWRSITQRWPRLRLHGTYSFGVATLLAAIAISQGFPDDNIDRLIALCIHYRPNENMQDLIDMYYNAVEVVPETEGVCMTELKLHRIMWEAGRQTCEEWLTDVYRLESGKRRTIQEAIETATNADAWGELWERIAQECSG